MISKWMTVDQLPEGYFKERLTEMVIEPALARVCVVAVTGFDNDWAAYIGWPTLDELKPEKRTDEAKYYTRKHHDEKDVAERGDKLSAREAHEIFPIFTISAYRQ